MLLKTLISPLLIVPSTKRGGEDEEVPIFEEAIRFCKNTKSRQTNIVEKNIEIIKSKIQLKENDIVLIEGLHCLNEILSSEIPAANKIKIYLCL